MSKTVAACPNCDSTSIYTRRPNVTSPPDAHTHRCESCGHRFDDPDERPVRGGAVGDPDHQAMAARSSKLVAKLLDADPDEVGT